MSRKGFKISKCGSSQIIQSAFAVKANSKIMLSSGSEEASIFFVGKKCTQYFKTSEITSVRSASVKYLSNLGRQSTSINSLSRGSEIPRFESMVAFLKALSLTEPLIRKALIGALVSTTKILFLNIPGRENEWLGRLRKSEDNLELISTSRTRVDKDFIDTYGLKLLAGRNFTDEQPKQIILNQTAVKMLGYKDADAAIGNLLMGESKIIGVVEDFHERSLHEPVVASMYTPGQGYMKFITVKINSTNVSRTIEQLQKQWATVFPDKPFDYFFLDEYFNRQYQKEQHLQKVFGYLSAIGLGIACLGLFGFTYFMTYQRAKEIGIRKTLGATMLNIIKLLSTEFAIVLLLAGAVGISVELLCGRFMVGNLSRKDLAYRDRFYFACCRGSHFCSCLDTISFNKIGKHECNGGFET